MYDVRCMMQCGITFCIERLKIVPIAISTFKRYVYKSLGVFPPIETERAMNIIGTTKVNSIGC